MSNVEEIHKGCVNCGKKPEEHVSVLVQEGKKTNLVLVCKNAIYKPAVAKKEKKDGQHSVHANGE